MFGSADLDIFFADFGSTVIAGSTTFKANFNSPGDGIDLQSLAPVSGVDYSIEYKTTSATLAARQQITVDGAPFQVTGIDPLDDGQITRAKLKSLSSPVGPGAGAPVVTLPWGRKSFNQVPDGARVAFTLTSPANPSLLQVFQDGQNFSSPGDYSLSSDGLTVTFTSAPPAGSNVYAYY